MSAFFKQRFVRGVHARIAAEDVRSGSRTGIIVLVILFIALVAILMRLAEFGRPFSRHISPPSAPGIVLLTVP